MRKYRESKTTRTMMATVPHVTSGSGLWKFQADGFLLDIVYVMHIRIHLLDDDKLNVCCQLLLLYSNYYYFFQFISLYSFFDKMFIVNLVFQEISRFQESKFLW